MDITVKNLQKKIPINPTQVTKIVTSILRREGVREAVLSVVFVTSQKIRALNKQYLGRAYTTDVLAFDLKDQWSDQKDLANKGQTVFGDIIISVDAARQNAKVYQSAVKEEVLLYIVHGILHLLGYDDHTPKDISLMRNKEQEVLNRLRLKL